MLKINELFFYTKSNEKVKCEDLLLDECMDKRLAYHYSKMLNKQLNREEEIQYIKFIILHYRKSIVEGYKSIKRCNKMIRSIDRSIQEVGCKELSKAELRSDIAQLKEFNLTITNYLLELLEEIEGKDYITDHDLCQLLGLNYTLWTKHKKEFLKDRDNASWYELLFYADNEKLANRGYAKEYTGYLDKSYIYTAIGEYVLSRIPEGTIGNFVKELGMQTYTTITDSEGRIAEIRKNEES